MSSLTEGMQCGAPEGLFNDDKSYSRQPTLGASHLQSDELARSDGVDHAVDFEDMSAYHDDFLNRWFPVMSKLRLGSLDNQEVYIFTDDFNYTDCRYQSQMYRVKIVSFLEHDFSDGGVRITGAFNTRGNLVRPERLVVKLDETSAALYKTWEKERPAATPHTRRRWSLPYEFKRTPRRWTLPDEFTRVLNYNYSKFSPEIQEDINAGKYVAAFGYMDQGNMIYADSQCVAVNPFFSTGKTDDPFEVDKTIYLKNTGILFLADEKQKST
jgi:hypothetical protein